MACSKYTLTNTGSTTINFSYQRCDDSLWDYQVELLPSQTKNIWVINGTYTIAQAFRGSVSLVNEGVFPPIFSTPTPTPTPSVTPTNTPTPSVTATLTPSPTQTGTAAITPTPSVTATITPSPTEPIRYNQADICHNEFNGDSACSCPGVANVWTDGVDLASSTVMFSDPTGPNTGNPEGYYAQGGLLFQVATDCGPGCTTGATITQIGVCGVTPTPTPTNTETPTQTPTMTPTPTSPLQVFNLSFGETANEACNASPSVTLYAFDPLFDQNVEFYNDPSGTVTSNIEGYYSNGSQVILLNGNGFIQGVFTLCSVVPTPTPTPTNTETPTPTPTMTQTPTQTFAWYTYTLGSGATPNDACEAFSTSPITIYGTIEGGVGPNVGEYLYETAGVPLTDAVPDGYYSNGSAWFNVTGGLGQITSADPDGCTGLPTQTPTASPSPTPTLTLTATPTHTPTPTVTPSGFGTNNFKVTILSSFEPITHGFVLEEIPYIGTSGVGFTGTTGTYPLSASTEGNVTNYGTHDGISNQTVSFNITASSDGPLLLGTYVNGSNVSFVNTSVVAGSNTVNVYLAPTYTISDTIEFRIG